MTARTIGIAAIGVLLVLLLSCLWSCASVPVVDDGRFEGFAMSCRWTWFDELGDQIDQASLAVCIHAAIAGQTITELRQVLRARPDFAARSRKNHYGRPPTLGLHAS